MSEPTSSSISVHDLRVIGVIAASHGLQGTFKVVPLSDFPERYDALTRVYFVRGDEVLCECTVKRTKLSGGGVLLTTKEITTRTEADTFRGVEVCVPESERWTLPDGVFYISDLIGYRGISSTGILIGELISVQAGAQDVLEFSGSGHDFLVPFVSEWVGRVDSAARTIEILNWEQLVEAEVIGTDSDAKFDFIPESGDH